MTAQALQYIVLCCIKSMPTLKEKYDKGIFFILTHLGMLQRPYGFLFSFYANDRKKKNTSVLKNT